MNSAQKVIIDNLSSRSCIFFEHPWDFSQRLTLAFSQITPIWNDIAGNRSAFLRLGWRSAILGLWDKISS